MALVSSSILGVSPNTVYAESGTGIAGGERCGLSAFSTAICFMAALLAAPLFLIVPFATVAPALVMIGWLMLRSLTRLDFYKASESFPAVIAVVVMGLSWLAYLLIKVFDRHYKNISLTSWSLGASLP